MSLKLSNDQDRLKRLLKNEAFSDEVYLKLFKLYSWGSDGIHESDDNRDITISFVKRFYRPDGFRDPAMIYAPTTVMNIAQESSDSRVLDAILSMPNHNIKISRREERRPKNLREVVAFNEAISQEGIKRLLVFGDENIDYFLASNSALNDTQQQYIFDRANSDIKMMLAHNSNLSDTLFDKLLEEDSEIVKTLLSFQYIDTKRLDTILSKEIYNNIVSFIGYNQTISDIIEPLLELDNQELDFKLATNSCLDNSFLQKLYKKYNDSIAIEICKNPNISNGMATAFYQTQNIEIIKALATNISTPQNILDELCERNDRELNRLLASNPSVSLSYLQQFQLDPTLIMILAKNETYGKNILNNLGL
jgi:hypothetical protein